MARFPTSFYERIRRPPSPSSVSGSLPVLFFGDLMTAAVVSVGINPSCREYLDRHQNELVDDKRRFETLTSLGATGRDRLTESECDRAIETMRGYFRPGRPVYHWFNAYMRVMQGLGWGYTDGGAAHLDLVQESTDPTWGGLSRGEREGLLDQDLRFLRWQLEEFPVELAICTSRLVTSCVTDMLAAKQGASGWAGKRAWTVWTAEVGERALAIVGWNRPLANAPGLTHEEQIELGSTLRKELVRLGLLT